MRYLAILLILCFKAVSYSASQQSEDSPCSIQLNFWKESLVRGDDWALDFFDLSGRPSSGVLHKNTRALGMFKECQNFRYIPKSSLVIQGKYCRAHFKSIENGDIRKANFSFFDFNLLGFMLHTRAVDLEIHYCVPHICDEYEIREFLNSHIGNAKLNIDWLGCVQKDELEMTLYDYIVVAVILGLISIIILSTLFDLGQRNSEKVPPTNLRSIFSVYTNASELLEISYTPTKSTITCLHGLRVIAAFIVIIVHRVAYHELKMSRPLDNDDFINQFRIGPKRWGVNTFFLMSAILVSRSCIVALEKKNLNLSKIYFNRYMRYGPSVAILVFIYTSFIPRYIVDGPFAFDINLSAQNCKNYWWSALLMMQTYVNPDAICFDHTWYLSSEFQLYLLAPPLVYLLWKHKQKMIVMFSLFLVVKAICEAYAKYNEIITRDLYYFTHYRLSQWILGLIIGYWIYHLEKSSSTLAKKFLNKCNNAILWIAIFIGYLITKYGYSFFASKSFEFYLFYSFSDLVSTFTLGLVIISCYFFPCRNLAQWFLSHPLWQPLAKLTLSIYLVHNIYIVMSTANIKDLTHFDGGWMFHIILGDFLISLVFGIILYLCVEAPVAKIVAFYNKKERNSEAIIYYNKFEK